MVAIFYITSEILYYISEKDTDFSGVYINKMDDMPSYQELLEENRRLEDRLTKIESETEILRRQSGFLDAVLNSIDDPVFVKDEEHNWLYLNDSMAFILRQRKEDLLGKTDYDVLPREQADVFWEQDDKVLATGESNLNIEALFDRTIATKKALLKLDDKKYIVGVIRDITDIKKAEEELRESQQLLYQMLDASPIPSFVIDKNHVITLLNRGFEILTGRKREEAIGKTDVWRHFYDHERFILADYIVEGIGREQISKAYPQGLRFDKIIPGAIEGEDFFPKLGKNGEWVQYTAAPIYGSDGDVIAAIETIQVITERRNAEEALKNSEKKFRELADAIPETIFEIDSEGRLRYVNDKAYTFFGYSKKDFEKGLNALDMIIDEDKERAARNIEIILKGEELGYVEYSVQKKDGTIAPCMIQSFAIYEDEKPAGVRGLIVDLTERKRLEERVRQSQKMQAIGTLAGGIAHDFNNILSAILGYTELSLTDPLEEITRKNLEEVRYAGLRARDLVTQILSFSRHEEQEYVPINPLPIIKESLKMLRASLPSTIKIEQDLDPNLYNILGEQTEIHQIMMNLCTNAMQSMKESGGILKISAKNEYFSKGNRYISEKLKPGDYIHLTVSDTGEGISERHLSRIFEPYFTTKSKGEGTGLGLSVVHGIVQKHGGEISVFSEYGKGTRFDIYIPRYHGKILTEKDQEISDVLEDRGSGFILLVDDEDSLLDIGKRTLEKKGYKVLTAGNGAEALRILQSVRPDLLITDQTMPEMTGDRLVKVARGLYEGLPTILTTGDAISFPEKEVKKLGCEYLPKPVTPNRLSATATKLLSGK